MQPVATVTTSSAETRSARQARGRRRVLTIAGVILPALIVYVLFVLYPIAQAVYYSAFDWNGLGPLEDFVGIDNYRTVLTDNVFQMAIRHNLVILVLSLLVQLPLALLVALLLRTNIPGRALFRTIFFLPYVLSEVITALIWVFMFRPDSGFINSVLTRVVPGFEPRAFLAEPGVVLYAIFAVITWRFFGFHMILYLAGLQGIPSDLEDAARLDGASRMQVLRDITLPLLGPTVRVSVFFSVLGSLQFFDLIWVMTKGGPINASNTMATYMYTYGFQRFQLGYGAAVSLVIFLICFGFSIAYQRLVMRRDLEGSVI